VASRASKRLDPFGLARLAISHKGMDLSIGDPAVCALRVGTREPLGIYAFGGSPAAFDLAKGGVQEQALALHPTREGRRVDKPGNRLGCGARADVAAWCAWLLLVRRKTEEETSQDARASPGRGGDRPQARSRTQEGPYKTSLLEMEEEKAS